MLADVGAAALDGKQHGIRKVDREVTGEDEGEGDNVGHNQATSVLGAGVSTYDERMARMDLKDKVVSSLQASGLVTTLKRQIKDVKEYVKSDIFKIMKFPQPERLGVNGKPARMIRNMLLADSANSYQRNCFDTLWESKFRTAVRDAINAKRSSVNQTIFKNMCNLGKKRCCCENYFGTLN